MHKAIACVLAFIFGAISVALIAGYLAFFKPEVNLTSPRGSDGICLKQLRLVRLVSTDVTEEDQTKLKPPRLCDSPSNTLVRPRSLYMTGDRYDVKCKMSGFVASNQPVVVFFWDRGEKYGEQIDVLSYAKSEKVLATPQCEKYGIKSVWE